MVSQITIVILFTNIGCEKNPGGGGGLNRPIVSILMANPGILQSYSKKLDTSFQLHIFGRQLLYKDRLALQTQVAYRTERQRLQ